MLRLKLLVKLSNYFEGLGGGCLPTQRHVANHSTILNNISLRRSNLASLRPLALLLVIVLR